jgi:N-acetylmuramoyl-L-alanine amidase
MITQSNLVRRSGYISRIMALPLLFLMVSAFAVKLTHKLPINPASHYANKTPTVVIDPGHGGIYPGAHSSNNILEKDIDLNIAQKIKELAPQYNINIILTRNSDELVGNATNLREDLKNRVRIANEAKSDLFVSIHVNATVEKTTSMSGFEAYISGRNDNPKARQLSSVILTGLKDIYVVNETIRQREAGIQVLDHNTCPAVMIQCGYITNPKDVEFITNPANQEKTARKILEGIVKYSNAQTAGTTEYKQIIAATISESAGVTGPEPTQINFQDKDSTNKEIFTKVEFEADYPGGQAGWTKYLIKSLHYPREAIKKELAGMVVVQFIVDTKGKISDVKAISGPKELQAESVRVIKQSGRWLSAVQNGKKVKAYKKQSITYKLSV